MGSNWLIGGIIGLIIGFLIGWSVGGSKIAGTAITPTASNSANIQSTTSISNKKLEFKMAMRKLWEDHITWTRMYLVSQAYNNPDANNIATRLLKNQEDLGNAIKSYYGNDAGDKLTSLLKEHINGAVALVNAAKANDQQALSAANDRWYKNANDIADFLSQANTNIPNNEMRAEMKSHLDLTKQEAVDLLNKKFDAGINDYDQIHTQILGMADALANSIIKQFPDKF